MTDLVALKSLESLSLVRSSLTDHGVAKLSALENLKALDLGQTKHVKGTGFERNQEFQNLSILVLPSSVTDEGLVCVGRLNGLKVLTIRSETSFTDVGISELGKLRGLKSLDLGSSNLLSAFGGEDFFGVFRSLGGMLFGIVFAGYA